MIDLTWGHTYCRDHRSIVTLSGSATSALASPKQMDLKEVFRHSCVVYFVNSSKRFSTSCFPYIEVLFFQITLCKCHVGEENIFRKIKIR